MIPIKLEIQGLYSYKEKQIIEFDKLTAAGLFGISPLRKYRTPFRSWRKE